VLADPVEVADGPVEHFDGLVSCLAVASCAFSGRGWGGGHEGRFPAVRPEHPRPRTPWTHAVRVPTPSHSGSLATRRPRLHYPSRRAYGRASPRSPFTFCCVR